MRHLKPFVLLVAPLAFALAALALPSAAQQDDSRRFAFADTTLLRDTLDLKFDELFHLADSLRVEPALLRALAVRHKMTLRRIAFLTDSLRMPVDSVGVIMERERFNPLAVSSQRLNAFEYTSSYSVARTSNTWTNSANYDLAWGPLFVHNLTDVSITRTTDGSLEERFKSRTLNTELGWRMGPEFSMGARINLTGSESFKPGSIYNNQESTNQFDFSVRSRQQPHPNVHSQINFFGGPFDEPNSIPVKSGFGGTLSGQLSYSNRTWLTQDLNVQASGRFGRAHLPDRPSVSTRDLSRDVRGTLTLFESSPIRLRSEFRIQRSELERPDTASGASDPRPPDFVLRLPSTNRSFDLGMRLQRGSEHYLNVSQNFSSRENLISVSRGSSFTYDFSTTGGRTFGVDGRTVLKGWQVDGRFSNGFPLSEQPRRELTGTGIYRERQSLHSRSIDGTLRRVLTARLVLQATGNVSLTSTKLAHHGTSNHTQDDYRQGYAIEGIYSASSRATTRLKLDVSRSSNLYLLQANSISTREDRTYRAEWHWTYRMLEGLTATQQNQIAAVYNRNAFAPQRNRLGLDYLTVTTLDAVITPRLLVDITHNVRLQPSGDYVRSADGLDYFNRADEERGYSMTGTIAYTPSPAITLRLQPTYQASDREGTVAGVAAPSNRRRALNFSGGASVNLRVGAKGQLIGSLDRTYQSSRQTRYAQGEELIEPRFQTDYWNGSLSLTWRL